MSNLKVGIVGLPNVGKSTLFNALLKRQQAYVANFPFATIEPNIGIVPVPDNRLEKLQSVISHESSVVPPIVPATCTFVDIAGLIAGAHKGEGLGNKFLSHIRETDAICHVVRAFTDEDIIKEGSVNPKADFETVETELQLADLQTLEKQPDPGNTLDKELKRRFEIVKKLKEAIEKGKPARETDLNEEEHKIAKQLSLLTAKPILVVLNVNEGDLKEANKIEMAFAKEVNLHGSQVIAISARVESELSALDEADQKKYLEDLGVKESGLERLIKKAFETLGLITFLTAGVKEVRAWTFPSGWPAVKASSVIHTDFEEKFIKADVVDFDKFIEAPGWKEAREKGYVRSEGRDYIMKDGEVVEFKIGT